MTTENFFGDLSNLSKSFSGELHSENFYERLDRFKNYSEYNEECKSLTKLRHGSSLKKICAKLLNYLKTNTISNKDVKYDVCILLNYWVYSNFNIYLYPLNSTQIYRIFANIERIWNDFILDNLKERENEICKPRSSLIIHDDWRERKYLYEYYADYDQIKQYAEYYPKRCKEFYEYIESKKKLYEHFKEPCPDNDTNKCPDFYDLCEQYNPENVLPTLKCHKEITDERAAAAAKASQKAETYTSSETNSEERDGRMMPGDAPKFSGNPKTVENVGNILLGVVATTMTSGALYRFTPLGGVIRNGFGWNTNNMRNFNGGDNGLYDYASGSFNPYTGAGEEHYIGYHPA